MPMPQSQMPPQEPPTDMPPQGSPDEAADVAVSEQQKQVEAIAASAPVPPNPYKVSEIESVVEEMNGFVKAVDPATPEVMWEPPQGEKQWGQPLPPEVYVPLVVIAEAIRSVGIEKHVYDPATMASDGDLKKVGGILRRASKDKKLLAALKPPEEAEPPAAPAGPVDMDARDKELASQM